MPSGKTDTPDIVDNKDGTVTVRYAPTEVGLHEMHIKYMGKHIPGESDKAGDTNPSTASCCCICSLFRFL